MKKHLPSTADKIILLVLLLLPSCSKMREYIEHNPADIGKYCRVESFNLTEPYPDTRIAHFSVTYNAAGNPMEMVQSLTDSIDIGEYSPDLHFRYDKKQRLTDVLFTDPGQTFVWVWDHYTYPAPHTIIDSIFYYTGNIIDGLPRGPDIYVQTAILQFDQQDRLAHIYKYSTVAGEGITDLYKTYDRYGDEISPGIQYDDKINVYQTNKAWQLYFLDYNRHNPISAVTTTGGASTQSPASYNTVGLPTRFLGTARTLFRLSFSQMNIQYSCDMNGPSVAR